ncbi:diaminopimelate epimerase [Salibacterium salarium]|uniref:Diaminopimelate epimerase n=1 Tax=Salibacterium salarium TaxID=284579 RepID=A0A428N709_9BACI|nr:diaminopimelate epimerase [Salibacterium salarium]RSL34142.1 diaminopimelate epimerase [Salibacterium salarium]
MNFTKMHGLGNSYIYVDLFEESLKEQELSSLAEAVADKNRGIGSDGLILIGPSETEDIRMRVFNADGSEARNCGNGIRCAVKLAYEKGIIPNTEITVETLGGRVKAILEIDSSSDEVERVTVDMGKPRLQKQQLPLTNGEPEQQTIEEPIQVNGETLRMTAVSMGNPHAVFFEKDIQYAPVSLIGPYLEKHEMFPEWANIEFVEMVSEQEMHFRVWERGSGMTQACGTGACAAVVAAVLTGRASKGKEIIVHLLGGDLRVTWDMNGTVWMNGPAETICTGIYNRK